MIKVKLKEDYSPMAKILQGYRRRGGRFDYPVYRRSPPINAGTILEIVEGKYTNLFMVLKRKSIFCCCPLGWHYSINFKKLEIVEDD